MFNYGYNQPQYGGGNGYQQPQQQMYQQPRMDYMQPVQPQPSGIQARPVAGREEAVAATVFPGSPMLFLDRTHGAVYYKAIDPQTNAVDFVDFAVVMPAQPVQQPQQTAPQYATIADIEAIRDEMAQIRDMIPVPPTRRTKGADNE